MARFQVRKRKGLWEVWVRQPGQRAWERLDVFPSWSWAMVMATGQRPYPGGAHLERRLVVSWA